MPSLTYKLTSTAIHSIQSILKVQNKPSFNVYFENLFNVNEIGWGAVKMLTHLNRYNFRFF